MFKTVGAIIKSDQNVYVLLVTHDARCMHCQNMICEMQVICEMYVSVKKWSARCLWLLTWSCDLQVFLKK